MASQAFAPVQLTQFKLEDFQTEEGVSNLNQFLTQIVKNQNLINGTAGPTPLPSGADLKGEVIHNVGGMGPDHAAVSKAFAEEHYSADAIAPKLEAGGTHSLKSVRRINDQAQRESYSNFLEGSLNTAPTTNTSTVSGSGGTVTVSAGYHLRVSGNVASYASRTDTLALPSSVTIMSLTRTSSLVTAVTATSSGFVPGSVVNVTGASDSSFNGSWIIVSAVGTALTWRQVAPNSTATGGAASQSGVYYYRLPVDKSVLALYGPYSADSQQNRLATNIDGGVLIAVVVLNGSGVDLTQSAAGATPPPMTGGVHVVNRL